MEEDGAVAIKGDLQIGEQRAVGGQALKRPIRYALVRVDTQVEKGRELEGNGANASVCYLRRPQSGEGEVQPMEVGEAVGENKEVGVGQVHKEGAGEGFEGFLHAEAENAHGGAGEVVLEGEAEGLEREGGVGEVADEEVEVGGEAAEGEGCEGGEAGVEGEEEGEGRRSSEGG